jgi:tRNA(Ile)-lysidine synthase
MAAFLEEEAELRLPWENLGISAGENTGLSLAAETFFSQPEIIREEALFQALDKLVSNGDGYVTGKKPRREVLRSFVRGRAAALDLGNCRLESSGSHITLGAEKRLFDKGFSVLIKNPGIYKLEALTIKAFKLHVDSCGETGFFAEYPLVVRSWKGKILVEDKKGKAAVLAPKGLVWKRESSAGAMAYFAFEFPEQLELK